MTKWSTDDVSLYLDNNQSYPDNIQGINHFRSGNPHQLQYECVPPRRLKKNAQGFCSTKIGLFGGTEIFKTRVGFQVLREWIVSGLSFDKVSESQRTRHTIFSHLRMTRPTVTTNLSDFQKAQARQDRRGEFKES